MIFVVFNLYECSLLFIFPCIGAKNALTAAADTTQFQEEKKRKKHRKKFKNQILWHEKQQKKKRNLGDAILRKIGSHLALGQADEVFPCLVLDASRQLRWGVGAGLD